MGNASIAEEKIEIMKYDNCMCTLNLKKIRNFTQFS